LSSHPAFAGKTVAASAISTIVRKSFHYLEKYIIAEGMKSVKERLERTLPHVQVVFDAIDMERIRDQSEALDVWLWQLRDAIEEGFFFKIVRCTGRIKRERRELQCRGQDRPPANGSTRGNAHGYSPTNFDLCSRPALPIARHWRELAQSHRGG
jgi:hypothetical protein